jgi:hypothetical protein
VRIFGYDECPNGYQVNTSSPGCCMPAGIIPPGGTCPPLDSFELADGTCPPGFEPDPNAAYCCVPVIGR